MSVPAIYARASAQPALPDPQTSTVALLHERCDEIAEWCETIADVPVLEEARRQVSAIEDYLAAKGTAGPAQTAARLLEARIGELLGPAKAGRPAGESSIAIELSDKSIRHQFRMLAAHRPVWQPRLPLSRSRALRLIRDETALVKREERDEREADVTDVPDPDLRLGNFADVLADVRDVDLVFTDPPYPGKFLPVWSDLSRWAATALKPGRMVVAYSGQYHLPEVIRRLSEHLTYVWTGWIATPGPNVSVHRRPIMSGGKVLLFFSKGEPQLSRRVVDTIGSEYRTRDLHTWEQEQSPAAYYIDALTERGELVVEPFLGAGTFAFVAAKLGRRVVGAELDPVAFETAKSRMP